MDTAHGRRIDECVFWHATAVAVVLLNLGLAAQAAVNTVSIFSPSNNRNLSFQVYTPPGYAANPAHRYPVVISLHGIGGNSQQRANLYAPTLDARTNSGELVPMIWLFPDGQTNSFYGDAFDGHKQVYSHIINEALPHVDAQYRTIDATRISGDGRVQHGRLRCGALCGQASRVVLRGGGVWRGTWPPGRI